MGNSTLSIGIFQERERTKNWLVHHRNNNNNNENENVNITKSHC